MIEFFSKIKWCKKMTEETDVKMNTFWCLFMNLESFVFVSFHLTFLDCIGDVLWWSQTLPKRFSLNESRDHGEMSVSSAFAVFFAKEIQIHYKRKKILVFLFWFGYNQIWKRTSYILLCQISKQISDHNAIAKMLSTVHPYSVFAFVDIAKKRFFAQKPKTSDHNTSLLRIVRSNYVEIDQLYLVMFIDIIDSESLNLKKSHYKN